MHLSGGYLFCCFALLNPRIHISELVDLRSELKRLREPAPR
jgi:hypothetical protein